MTPLELRIIYKLETGFYPLYNQNVNDRWLYGEDKGSIYSHKIDPSFKNSYISWLEETYGTQKQFRNQYIKEFNQSPVKENSRSSQKYNGLYYMRQKVEDYFYQNYEQWLENYILNNF